MVVPQTGEVMLVKDLEDDDSFEIVLSAKEKLNPSRKSSQDLTLTLMPTDEDDHEDWIGNLLQYFKIGDFLKLKIFVIIQAFFRTKSRSTYQLRVDGHEGHNMPA